MLHVVVLVIKQVITIDNEILRENLIDDLYLILQQNIFILFLQTILEGVYNIGENSGIA